MRDPVGDIHLDFGQLNLLMCVKDLQPAPAKVAVTAAAALRDQRSLPGRCEHLVTVSLVAFLSALGVLAFFAFLFPPAPVEGTVRGGRLAGILRIFPGSYFQLFKAFAICPELLFLAGETCRHISERAFQIKNVMPDGLRGQVPFQLAERSFGFHENEAIIGETKNLDFFSILSVTYNMSFCCFILMG